MRADEGKSVLEMDFLAPVTPAKPMVLGQRQIYQNGQEILSNQGSLGEAGAYRAQVSLVSKMGGSNHYQAGIGDEANQADRWTPLYSASTRLSGSTSDNNSVHGSLPFGCGYDTSQEMNAVPKVKETDPFTQWNHMPFCDLLAMNNGGVPAVLGGSMNPLVSNDFFLNLNPQTSFMFENQGIMGGVESILVEPNKTSRDLQGSNQQLNERIEIQQSGFSRNSCNSYDLNALPNAENELQYDDRYANIVNAVPDGGIHVFAPETPDHFKRLGNDAPGKIAFPADKQPSKQNENDNQVSIPVVDNWIGISEIRSPANSIAIESYSPDKGGELDLEQNKTPQPKARRKKHRPKVVREVKPKQTPIQKQPKASNKNETPTTQKRKYVRKNKTKTPSTTSPTRAGLSSKVPDTVVRSCRKTLNFDLEDQVKESNSSHRSSNAPSSEQLPLNREGKDEMEATQEYDAYDISVRNNQILKDYMSMPEGRARDVSQATFPQYESNAAREYERGIKRDRRTSMSSKRNSAETCASSIGGEHTRGAKRANSSLGDASYMARGSFTSQGTPSEVNHMYLRSAILNGIHGMYFPEIFKKRRTEKVLKPNTLSCASTSKYYYSTPAPHFNVNAEPSNQATTFHSHEDKSHFINWANIDKLKQKKKRSKMPTRVRELDSLKGFAECRRSTAKQKVKRTGKKNVEKYSHRSSMEVLPLVSSANRTGKRQSRKRSTKVKSVTSSYDIMNKLSLELHKDEQLTGNANGPFLALPWKDTFSVDAVIEGMEQLNINKQGSNSVRFKDQNILVPYHFKKHFQNQQQNALVLYQRDGSVIPFEGTQTSKRRSRARVDLDDETSRVWKLLLEDINSQGIDGTDEEKAKWWENERKVFCGRVDSFIARMRLVQGDRHFSPWKGSVVDSVVGVFLTQNVSDHLSSSAFMSVAARFPVNPTDKVRMHPEEEMGPLVEEPESFIVDLNDNGESLEWNEKTVAVPSCDRNSRILHDTDVSEESHGSTNLKDETWCSFNSSQEKPHESILYRASSISKESEIVSASADARRIDDVSSSQLSVISCQNSVESPNVLMGSNISSREDMTACSKPSSLNCSGSFVELLRMAGTPKVDATYVSKDQMPSYKSDVPNEEGIKDEHIKKADTTQMLDSFSNVQSKCSTVYELHVTEGYILQGVDEESRSVSSTRSSQDFTTEQIKATESTSECLLQEKASESNLMSNPIVDNVCSCYVLEGEDMIILTPRQPVETQQDMIIQTPRQPVEMQQDMIIQTPRQPFEMQQDMIIQTPRQPVEMQQDMIIQTPRQPVEMQQDMIIQTPRQPVEMQQDMIIQTPRQPVEMQQDMTIQTPRQPVDMQQDMIIQTPRHPVEMQQDITNSQTEGSESSPKRNPNLPALSGETGVTESTCASNITVHNEFTPNPPLSGHNHTSGETHHAVRKDNLQEKTRRTSKKASYDWENLRKEAQVNGKSRRQTANTMDSVDWEAVRRADVNEVAKTIKERGMNNVLAERIKEFLDRIVNDHGSIDLEWLRDVPPDKAKEYLLSIRGLGLKSVECVRLLTLHQLAFPVDTNVGRIAVRLGWVPLQPLPESLQLHLLELYPILESIQKYLWPRLCKLDQRTLYELHYHLITFGKVFCTKKQPNCNACPLRGECRHFASAFASARLALPAPEDKRIVPSYEDNVIPQVPEDKRIVPSYEDNAIPQVAIQSLPMPLLMADHMSETKSESRNSEPIVEIPASPEAEPEQLQTLEYDIEDALDEDPNEIPTIKLNLEQFTNTLQTYMQSNMELQDGEMSKALVALATEAASIPTPRLKNVNRLRTEHHVYELPDTHQLLRGLDKREPDDPCSYLLAIWTPGETANSIEAPEKKCNSQEPGELCGDETCFYCNSQREANSQIVRGTLLIPCRTAMRGSFPLNGTYFQVNEVFADHDSSLNPIEVPRQWIWNLPRRTVYFGTSIPSIFKGLSTEGIQHCFWRGYVCVRGFEQKTRSPRPLMARLHFPASKLARPRGRNSEQDV